MSLPHYPEYKESGVEWLGEVPTHWSVAPLKHLVSFTSGGTPSKEIAEYWDGSVPWASAKDLKSERLSDTTNHITEYAVSSGAASLVPAGTVLVVVRGMILARTFPVTQTLSPMAINQDLKGVRPTDRLDTNFLPWLLRGSADESLQRLDEAGHGTKALRMDAWSSMRLPVPPHEEQRAIATFLESETAKIDALISEQEKLLALLAEKRQATISRAVTKGLNPDAPMKDSGVEWLGQVPAHWNVIRVKRAILSIAQGWSPQCENQPVENYDEWGVLKVGCVNGGVFNEAENKRLPPELDPLSNYALRKGDLLVSRANTLDLVGSAAVVPRDFKRLLLCDKLYRLCVDTNTCSPHFLAAFIGTREARSQIELDATGASSSMLNIGQSVILNLPVPLPPVTEQAGIMESIRTKTARLDTLSSEATRAIDLLKERRTALISAAVTGKIDVRQP